MSATIAAVAGLLTHKLSPTWQALTALGGAFAIGAAIALSSMGVRTLPATVAAHTDSIRQLSTRVAETDALARRVDRQYTRIVCILTLPDSLSAIEGEGRCQ